MEQDWNDSLYQRAYDQMYALLCERRRCGESAQAIRDQLAWEYVASGVDWVGKGAVWHITQEATIAAYETFLAAWDEEPSA